jgi:hypothetical protein
MAMGKGGLTRFLNYAFAKEHGVIVLEAGETAVVGVREGARPTAILRPPRDWRAADG